MEKILSILLISETLLLFILGLFYLKERLFSKTLVKALDGASKDYSSMYMDRQKQISSLLSEQYTLRMEKARLEMENSILKSKKSKKKKKT